MGNQKHTGKTRKLESGQIACLSKSLLRRRIAQQVELDMTPPIVHNVLRSPSQPLDATTRVFMESHFSHDFSQVRVHADTKAAESARAVNAFAYTVGRNVVFGEGSYAPTMLTGQKLLPYELTHIVQQAHGSENVFSPVFAIEPLNSTAEREADATASAKLSGQAVDNIGSALFRRTMEQKNGDTIDVDLVPSEPIPGMDLPKVSSDTWRLIGGNQPAVKETKKCEEFPGGSTTCEVDEKTGTLTGKVRHRIDETNRCTRPCVEEHEEVHIKQLKKFCPKLRDCYLAADKGKRHNMDCLKMAVSEIKARECEAYKVSVPCMENRLKNAKECKSEENKTYGTRKLASEKCFRDSNCGGSGR